MPPLLSVKVLERYSSAHIELARTASPGSLVGLLPNNRASAASVKPGAMGASGVAAPAPGVTDKLVGCMR